MSEANGARGLIAVDKMGGRVLFLNPATYATEVVLDGFPRTVHELLVIRGIGLAYVPIFGDGIHGRNPNPGHHRAVERDIFRVIQNGPSSDTWTASI